MYQGFCRMESPVTNKIAPFWKNLENIRLGGCFKVRWLRKSDLPFSTMPNYRNSLNNNEPIRKSRDTQEIPGDIGRDVCLLFKVYELTVGSAGQTSSLMNTPNYPGSMDQSSLVDSPVSDTKSDTAQQRMNSAHTEEQKHDNQMDVETKKNNVVIDLYDIDLDPVYEEADTTATGANVNTGNAMEQEVDNRTTKTMNGGTQSDNLQVQKDVSNKMEVIGTSNLTNGPQVESKPVIMPQPSFKQEIQPPPSIRTETTQPISVTSPKEERKVPELPIIKRDDSTESHSGIQPVKPIGYKPAPPIVKGPYHPHPGSFMPGGYHPYQPGYPNPHHPGMIPHPSYSHPPMPYSNPYQPPGPHHYGPYPPYSMGMHPGPYPYGPGPMYQRFPVGNPGQPMPGVQPTNTATSTTTHPTTIMKPEDADKDSRKNKQRDKSKDGSDDEGDDSKKAKKAKKDKEKDKDKDAKKKKKKDRSRSRSKSKKKHQ